MNLPYCNSKYLYLALVLIREQSDKRKSDIAILRMKNPSSYILANLANHFSQPGRKMKDVTMIFFPNALRDCGAGCQGRDNKLTEKEKCSFPL